jgi:PAS domain S-box-containing protein
MRAEARRRAPHRLGTCVRSEQSPPGHGIVGTAPRTAGRASIAHGADVNLDRTEARPLADLSASHGDAALMPSLLEAVADAVIAVDADYRVVYFGPGAERLYRVPRGRALGRALIELYRYEWLDAAEEARALAALDADGVWRGENVHVLPDGTRLYVESVVTALRTPDGRRSGLLAVMRDRTAQRAAEERVRRHQRTLEQLLDALPVMICRYDPDLSRVVFNRCFEQQLGWTAADAQAGDIMALCYTDAEVRAATAAFMAQPGSGWREIPTRAKDGGTRRVMWSNVQLASELQVGVGVDVTALEEAKARAVDVERRLNALADSLPQIVWSTTADGETDYVNDRWYEYTGLSREHAFGEGWVGAMHPDERAEALAMWRDANAAGRPFEKQQRLRGHDGVYRWFLSRAQPVRGADGRVVAWFGSCTDIEDVKRAEQTLRDEDRRKDEFIAVLAHELRNPLAPIRHAVHVLGAAASGSGERELGRQVIERQVATMARLLDDLLDLSRITRGRLELRRERVALATVIERAVETSRPLVDARRHALHVHPVPDAWLRADPVRLCQAIANLLNNAAKFTPPGGRIDVACTVAAGAVTIEVRDTGSGLAPDLLGRVFEMFVQAPDGAARASGAESGLGIGLSLVRGLAELHGGRVAVRSDGPGRGATFVVELPLDAADAGPADAAPATPTAVAAPATARRVLVADDNRDAAATLAMLLEMEGHDVRVANDGLEALAAFEAFRPEYALLDIGMPRLDGYALAREVRARAPEPRPVLVAITGWGQAHDRARAFDAGYDLHLTKPVDPATILERLRAPAEAPPGG